MGIKEYTCYVHRVFYVSVALLNCIPETNTPQYVNSLEFKENLKENQQKKKMNIHLKIV